MTVVKERTIGDTPKSKRSLSPILEISLSLLEKMTICWIPFPMDTETKELLMDLSKVRSSDTKKVPVFKILSDLVKETIEKNREDYLKETEDIIKEEISSLSDEEREKMRLKLERDMKKMMEKMKSLK